MFLDSLKPSFSSCLAGFDGRGEAGSEGALCEVLEGLADPHAGPIESPNQGDEDQQQHHGPGGVDPLVALSLSPRPRHQPGSGDAE